LNLLGVAIKVFKFCFLSNLNESMLILAIGF